MKITSNAIFATEETITDIKTTEDTTIYIEDCVTISNTTLKGQIYLFNDGWLRLKDVNCENVRISIPIKTGRLKLPLNGHIESELVRPLNITL